MTKEVVRKGGDWKWRAFGHISSHIDEDFLAGNERADPLQSVTDLEGDALERAARRGKTGDKPVLPETKSMKRKSRK